MTTIKIFINNLEDTNTDDILTIASYLTNIENFHIHKEYEKELELIKELYESYYISFKLEYTIFEYETSKSVFLEFCDYHTIFSATTKVVYTNNNQLYVSYDELENFWNELIEYDFDLSI